MFQTWLSLLASTEWKQRLEMMLTDIPLTCWLMLFTPHFWDKQGLEMSLWEKKSHQARQVKNVP